MSCGAAVTVWRGAPSLQSSPRPPAFRRGKGGMDPGGALHSAGSGTGAGNAAFRVPGRLDARSRRRTNSQAATARDPSSGTADTRGRTLSAISEQGPFVTDASVYAARVTYSSPLEYNYSAAEEPTAETSQNTLTYSSTLTKSAIAELMVTFTSQHAALPRSGIKVLRVFQPDPSTSIVRWAVTWGRNGDSATAEGTTKYVLDREGLVSRQNDTWEVLPEDGSESPSFKDCFTIGCARRPPGAAPLVGILQSLPSVRLAAWEALKSNPNYGGQLVREEMDVFTMQLVYACVGLGGSLLFLVARLVTLSSQN